MLTRITAVLLAALAAGAAAAQEMPPLPTAFGEEVPRPSASSLMANGGEESIVRTSTVMNPADPRYEIWDNLPAVAETSGTWIDRGFWYSEIEAVAMVRHWNRQRLTLANDVIFNGGGNSLNSFRALTLGRSTPGREGSARFTLGRFLFRDQDNRDHAMEFTVLGGGEFGQNSELFAANDADPFDQVNESDMTAPFLAVSSATDLLSLISFDGAESMFIQYDSRMNSFEMNYTLSTRLGSDRMELMPSGEWVRRANSGLTYSFLGGLRYVDLTENVAWDAFNITNITSGAATPLDGETGAYRVRTSNDIFGPQVGFGANYESGRFSIESLTKLGVLANDLKTRSGLTFTDPATGVTRDDISFTNSNRTDTLTVMTEFSVVGRYHFQPNISWRLGYHMLLLSHVALAPHQLDFEPDDASVSSTGDVFYHGISTGLDFYW